MLEIQKHASVAAGAALAGRNLQTTLADIWRRHPKLDAHERGAIQDIAYGVARHGGLLHALLDNLATKEIKEDRKEIKADTKEIKEDRKEIRDAIKERE